MYHVGMVRRVWYGYDCPTGWAVDVLELRGLSKEEIKVSRTAPDADDSAIVWALSVSMGDAVPLALLVLRSFFDVFLVLSLLAICLGFIA